MIERVSVILPVHDGERYVCEALQSVVSQTRPPDEVVVVDDGSTDGTANVALGFRGVRCIRQARTGQAGAIDAGVGATTGGLLAFLDADDRWLPEKLALQLDALRREPDVEIVFGCARQFVEGEASETSDAKRRIFPARLPSAMLIRRSAWERVGPMSREWTLGSVIEWCARADDLGLKARMLDAVVYERRIHGKNSSLVHANAADEYASMLRSVIARRKERAAE